MNTSFYIYDVDIEDWVRDLGPKINIFYNPTTLNIPARFNRNKNLFTMEQIRKRIEEGYVIVPVSKSVYAIDLLKYYNLDSEGIVEKVKSWIETMLYVK